MAFTFDPIFATDPNNAANVAANASVTIFDPADGTMAPITITDVTDAALSNPITVNKNGFGPAFQHATLDRVGWSGGGFTGYFTSYEGMKAVATDAADAAALAQSAAETAAADAAAYSVAPTDAQVDSGIVRADIPGTVAAVVPALVEAQVPSYVPAAVDDYISTDPTVAQNAATLAQSDAGLLKAIGASTADLNTFLSLGIYDPATTSVNMPVAVRGILEVFYVGAVRVQRFTTWELTPRVFLRRYSSPNWSTWITTGWGKGANNVDLNTILTEGAHEITSSSVTNLPVGIVGTLEVLKEGSNYIQRYNVLETARRVYVRHYVNSTTTWTAWTQTTMQDADKWVKTPTSADLNTLKTAGSYDITSTTTTNIPSPVLGSLEVLPFGASAGVQRFSTWNALPVTWVRRWSGTTFSAWQKITTEADVNTLVDAKIAAIPAPTGGAAGSTKLVAWGDSITEARGFTDPYIKILGDTLGLSYANKGWHGASTQNIAMQQGGHPIYVRFPSNTIPGTTTPVSTTQAVSFENPVFPLRSGNTTETLSGTVMDVPGTLTYDGTAGIITWTRTTAGDAVTVQGDAKFTVDQGELYRPDIPLIWSGHNNSGNKTDVEIVAMHREMVDFSTQALKRFIILENLAGDGWSDPTNRNWLLSQEFPGNFARVASYLRSQECATFLGHTLTSQDLSDIAAGWTPSSYRTDTLHLNSLGRQGVAEYLRQFIVAKGWV